jgi:hypothetical protein
MKDWIESTKADENSSAQNSTTAQLLPSASLSSQRRTANTMLVAAAFIRQSSIHEQKSPPSVYFDVSLCFTDLTKSTETPAMSAICSRL